MYTVCKSSSKFLEFLTCFKNVKHKDIHEVMALVEMDSIFNGQKVSK